MHHELITNVFVLVSSRRRCASQEHCRDGEGSAAAHRRVQEQVEQAAQRGGQGERHCEQRRGGKSPERHHTAGQSSDGERIVLAETPVGQLRPATRLSAWYGIQENQYVVSEIVAGVFRCRQSDSVSALAETGRIATAHSLFAGRSRDVVVPSAQQSRAGRGAAKRTRQRPAGHDAVVRGQPVGRPARLANALAARERRGLRAERRRSSHGRGIRRRRRLLLPLVRRAIASIGETGRRPAQRSRQRRLLHSLMLLFSKRTVRVEWQRPRVVVWV